MTITDEIHIKYFEAWNEARDNLNYLIKNGYDEQLENILNDLYPNGMTATELNDLLWFDFDTIKEWLGIESDEE